MRKLEKEMIVAVRSLKSFSKSNTAVNVDGANVRVYLHGNLIYQIINGVKSFSLAGWNSNTTRSRLQALGVNVCRRNYLPMYNGVVISSNNWYTID